MAEVSYDIVWTDKSKEDLREIYHFLCGVITEERAFSSIESIISEADVLIRMPSIGQREPKFEKLEKTYRRLVRGNYKIVYHVAGETVYINCVFHTSQDPEKLTVE